MTNSPTRIAQEVAELSTVEAGVIANTNLSDSLFARSNVLAYRSQVLSTIN
jgi:hypothetical protein